MEFAVIITFCAILVACLAIGFNLIYALLAGFVLFSVYAFIKGFSFKEIAKMAFSGIKTVKNILLTFILIGMITALWRASGTIPYIVSISSSLISPQVFLPVAFILNCLISFLTGTAFGTAATVGVICATIAASVGFSPALTGGAVLAGAYFGDRCSPVSTSALLVSTITKTNIFSNIKKMLATGAVPFVISCVVCFILGSTFDGKGEIPNLEALFGKEFVLSPIVIIPAVLLLVLAILKLNVRVVMSVGIITAFLICVFVQKADISELLFCVFKGYSSEDPNISMMLDGGGILSMLRVTAIVCISSSYSGIFNKTGLLNKVKKGIGVLAGKTTVYVAILLTSIISGCIACNQTLTIMLAEQLCNETEKDKERFAIMLEDSAVVISPLIPWSIAGAVPLASIGAPTESILFAFFLYLLPIVRILHSFVSKKKNK
ncbi:MAG: sodium:proton antiporter [Ruminococcaceae bacterium]|nr:sodium:proton antiporter [Oscillospiraceae bacterium]